ncbi:hypothetical protein Mfer_0331 [Methanothermus fervidus DSM 2088]|uniref:Uncharacterized protein n=1 Tax=Methanothermus fervidus (strain ATCC 43054 / DSM 2088 / JCM 10308 / V24 S) TaxID=523846 RepID=E3GXV2_METFV|nr:hypothetical protein [Methanothermus fervidus]ADP77134.1 hypothetical protein Mfer_0331 [Methanothermus fervidus DSM 2088]
MQKNLLIVISGVMLLGMFVSFIIMFLEPQQIPTIKIVENKTNNTSTSIPQYQQNDKYQSYYKGGENDTYIPKSKVNVEYNSTNKTGG